MSSKGENSLNFDCGLIYLVTAGLETSLLGDLTADTLQSIQIDIVFYVSEMAKKMEYLVIIKRDYKLEILKILYPIFGTKKSIHYLHTSYNF